MISGVIDCKIIFRYRGTDPATHQLTWYNDSFESIHRLKEFFTRCPGAGTLVKYGRSRDPFSATKAVLLIEYMDKEGKHTVEFPDALMFAKFLDKQTEIADRLGYRPKTR